MKKVMAIVDFINEVENTQFKSQLLSELNGILDDVVNQIDLKSQVEHPANEQMKNLTKELELVFLLRSLASEMLLQKISLNSKIEFVDKILKQK